MNNLEVSNKKTFWQKIKSPLFFTLFFLPIIIISVIFTCLYQFELYPSEVMQELLSVFGSKFIVIIISTIQSIGLILICCFFGYILADKVGLLKSIKKDGKIKLFEKKPLLITFIISMIAGILLSLDYWTFGKFSPQIQNADTTGVSIFAFLASIFYGGICEEIMMRLFLLSLFVFIIWKMFFRKSTTKVDTENTKLPTISSWVFIIANILTSLIFALGHLPATIITFGSLTPLILFRCFLYNGVIGYTFGWIYIKYGLQYSIFSHITVHVVSKIIWILFI